MLEILRFIFQSFWHFIGFIILFGILSEMIVKIIRGYPPCEERDNDKEED